MTYEHVLIERIGGVGVLTLDRPAKLNALNRRLSTELHDAVARFAADDEIGCIVVTGAGDRAFSAGGDIHEQRELDATETPEEARERRALQARQRFEIGTCPKPTIGMINGLAYGGAAVLASSLDIRVGCEHASFRFLAAGYGRINGTWTLPNQVGWPIAKELMFTGRIVEAEEAGRIGLLNRVVPCRELRTRTLDLAQQIAENDGEAIVAMKRLLLLNLGAGLEGQWAAEAGVGAEAAARRPAKDAFASFLERRPASDPG